MREHSYNIMNDDIDDDIEISVNTASKESSLNEITLYPQEEEIEGDSYRIILQKSVDEPDNTTTAFSEKLRQELEHIDNYISSRTDYTQQDIYGNSPITLSCHTSNHNSDTMSEPEPEPEPNKHAQSVHSDSTHSKKKIKYKKLTYEEVEHSLNKHYNHDNKFSNEFDMLITFIKGQKHLYTQSNKITMQKVNLLSYPCIFITASIMVFAPIIQDYSWSGWFLTALNALLTFLMSLLNFTDLQNSAQTYMGYANHFDRLDTSLEMVRNQLYFLDNPVEKEKIVLKKIQDTEQRMMEMKDANSVLIPNEVQDLVPIISHVNIFSFLQKIEQYKKNLIMEYKDVKNEIRYIMHKWDMKEKEKYRPSDKKKAHPYISDLDLHYISFKPPDSVHKDASNTTTIVPSVADLQKQNERKRMVYLVEKKETIKHELMNYHNAYSYIDEIFTREIQTAEEIQGKLCFLLFYWFGFKPKFNYCFEGGNYVVDQYLNFVFCSKNGDLAKH